MSEKNLMRILEEQMGFTDLQPLKSDTAGVAGAGTRKCFLFRGKDPNGSVLAIKAGDIGSEAGNEVLKNFEAYELSKSLGVDVIPDPYRFVQQDGMNVLTMEYGKNFIMEIGDSWVEEICERDAGFLFLDVADRLKEVYIKTLRSDAEASKGFVRQKIADQARYFEAYLIPAGLVDDNAAIRIKALDVEKLAPEKVTWTTGGELTPEHVCIGERGPFVIDPRSKEEIMGLPQIDLGMFAVLSRDVYVLPGCSKGYEIMKTLGEEIGQAQGLDENMAKALWTLAEMRQFSLSSRFRIGTEDDRAAKYASIAQEKLEALEAML